MTKNQKGFLVVGVVLAAAGAAYYFFKKSNAGAQVKQLADRLVQAGLATKAEVVATFEQSYLKAWYDAYKAGADTFTHKGKIYNVKGGKAI